MKHLFTLFCLIMAFLAMWGMIKAKALELIVTWGFCMVFAILLGILASIVVAELEKDK